MNIIELVLDCASYNRIEDTVDHPSPMPFLMSMKKKGVWCTKCYSQGPYTEAALMGLTFGKDTLDDNGYFASFFDWEKSIYSQFKAGGFDVFVTYSYSVMPKEVKTECNYSDSSNYCTPFFSRFIRSRLDYYHSIFRIGELQDEDRVIIAGFLENVFDVMLNYYTPETLANDHTRCAFEIRTEEQKMKIAAWQKRVSEEKEKFNLSPSNYVETVLSEYENHFLVRECDLFPSDIKNSVKKNREWIKRNRSFFSKLYWMKLREYLFINHPNKGQIWHYFKLLFNKRKRHIALEFYKRYIKAAFFYNKKKMFDNEIKQLLPCARNDIDSLLEWLKDRDSNKPYYAYIHVDDYHGESVLCSYDTDDMTVLNREFHNAENYLKEVKRNSKGDVVKDLSLKYLDGCIEHLFDELNQIGKIEDTIVVITADHGSSNAGGPFRYTNTNNFYDEQYHPILYIYGLQQDKIINRFINGKDIARTLLEIADIPFVESFNGVNFLNDNTRSHTYVEYMGTGMPDLIRRPIFFEYRDEEVSYVLTIKLADGKESLALLEYYDLRSDPLEYKNIAEKHNREKNKLFECFEQRFEELQCNYSEHLNKLKQKYLVGSVN